MTKQNMYQIYDMCSIQQKDFIIGRIDRGILVSETQNGKIQNWWKNKHYPRNTIPEQIYRLGQGTIPHLYAKYISTYGIIKWEVFLNYTREMIKQQIMISSA